MKKNNKKANRNICRWFTRIDENTIELKEKWRAFLKIALLIPVVISLYFDFINPDYRQQTIDHLKFSFQPETRFQKSWEFFEDSNNLGYTSLGTSKEQFIKNMEKKHKNEVWYGYSTVGFYVFFTFLLLYPNRRRIRFDRQRGIIYTYAKGKLYVTEINKLARPLNDYLNISSPYKMTIWVHPYLEKQTMLPTFARMNFSDHRMQFWRLLGKSDKSQTIEMQRFLIDFMNPHVDDERLADMQSALSRRKNPLDWLLQWTIGWLDTGLYCKRLPKQAVLEKQLAHYFNEISPTIKMHASWRKAKRDGTEGKYSVMIISEQENRRLGYQAPCKNLFDPPEKAEYYGKWQERS